MESKIYTAQEMRNMVVGLEQNRKYGMKRVVIASPKLIEMLRQAADAMERERGYMAAMREALQSILCLAYEVNDANADGGTRTSMPTQFVIDTIKSAIASPAHNREKKYEYAVKWLAENSVANNMGERREWAESIVRDVGSSKVRLVRREVGEWEEVRDGER